MSKRFFALVFCVSLLVSVFVPVSAQTVTPTPEQATAVPAEATLTPVSTPGLTASFSEADVITFEQVGKSETILTGPYDTTTLLFGVPADWNLTGGASLDLFMTVVFNTNALGSVNSGFMYGGTFYVRLNGVTVGILTLNQVGDVHEHLVIPETALHSRRSDGRMELTFLLDSGLTCQVNQQMNVIVQPISRFILPHTTVTPDTSLVNFPRPIYQDSIYPDTALVVVPEKATAGELQSALTVAAGLGNLTSSALTMTLTTVNELTPEQQATQHLILVGNAASLPMLNELNLPMPASGSQFQGSNPDDGVVQMVNSPWNPAKAVLLVSGNNDAGTIKAAQAVSTGILRSNSAPNLALIEQVDPQPVPVSLPVDQKFSDMGYDRQVLERLGINTATYNFYIPPGQTLAQDSYLELVYGHSALLDYDRSGVVVLLNDQPIGSARFSDATAAQSINQVQITIPSSVVVPGRNRLDVRATLVLRDNCIGPELNGQWLTIWPESRLHLPLSPAQASPELGFDLSAYPLPFVLHPTLGSTAFVLQRDDPKAWRTALRIARYLGDRTNGPLTTLAAFFGDDVPAAERAKYNFLVIGRPSQMPVVKEINASLPAPFGEGGDIASENNLQVKYRVPSDSPIGYVQMLPSPWNPDLVVIAALGNDVQGVAWASSALVDAPVRSLLAGNFAVINGRQVISTDTRLKSLPAETAPGEVPGVAVVQPSLDLTLPVASRPAWILPALVVSAALAVLILLVVATSSWARNRARHSRGG